MQGSTLFPYTTLFRSRRNKDDRRVLVALSLPDHRGRLKAVDLGHLHIQQHHRKVPLEQDRKSTRLNSSHLVISYAVFCLKKNMFDGVRSYEGCTALGT